MEDTNKAEALEGESNWEQEAEGKEDSTNKWRWVFLFGIGFLLGVSIKAQAVKTTTMGFSDYKLKSLRSDFQMTAPKEEAAESQEQELEQQGDEQGGQPEEEPVEIIEEGNSEQE